MMKKLLSLVVIFVFGWAGSSYAQMQIGYMDTQQVLNQLPGRQKIQKKMDAFVKQKKKVLKDKAVKYQKAVSEYQSSKASMTDDQIETRKDELSALRNSLNQFNNSVQKQVRQKRQQLLAPIFGRIDSTITAVAKRMNLDLVLNKSTGTGERLVYYASENQTNITKLVLKRLKSSNK